MLAELSECGFVQAYGQRDTYEPDMELQAAVLNQETFTTALSVVTPGAWHTLSLQAAVLDQEIFTTAGNEPDGMLCRRTASGTRMKLTWSSRQLC